MGIAKSIHNCLGVASGNYLFKVDADLGYRPNWLKEAVSILDHKEVGCVGLFDYRNYDPNDGRFNKLERKENFFIVDDFVASLYGFTKDTYEKWGRFIGQDGWHNFLQTKGYDLAISSRDLISNFGFGLGKSIFVEETKGGLKPREYSQKSLTF